jgi:hypothetical protein
MRAAPAADLVQAAVRCATAAQDRPAHVYCLRPVHVLRITTTTFIRRRTSASYAQIAAACSVQILLTTARCAWEI